MKIKGVEKVLRAIANEYVITVEGNNLVARDPRGESIGMMRNRPGNQERLKATLDGRRIPTLSNAGSFSCGNGMGWAYGKQYK